MNEKQVAELFVEQQVLQPSQAEDVLNEANLNGKTIVQAMVDSGFVDESGFYRTIAEALGAEYIDFGDKEVAPAFLKLIPSGLARLHRALPIGLSGNTLRVALADAPDPRAAEDLRFALGKDVDVVVAPTEQIDNRIKEYYGADTTSMEEVLKQLGEAGEMLQIRGDDTAEAVEAEANATPIIRFVDLILYQAIQDRASDIHFEPFENEFKIRYRVDGALYEMSPPPRHLALPVISRVKVMANMNIAERRLPQDGRIQKNIAGRHVDLRVSTLPTQFGESVVLRVLDRSTVNLDLEMLGMPEYVHNYILEIINCPNGIFIATGPTGSGKTTTLYSCLRKINTIDSKLLTAEEPIEYDLEGIVQVPVNEAIGLTFARVLRAFLRQDPDRIMLGETRDLETAQIAIQASLTGHLVFTTLHTNDAPGAITRLIDMGVEPFLISATLAAVLGQRLLRSICPNCRAAYTPNASLLAQIELAKKDIGDRKFFYGKGCDSCNNTGYKGRKGIYELMKITDPLRELVNERAPTVVLKQKAAKRAAKAARVAQPREKRKGIVLFQRKKVKPKILMIFTRQLATLIDAGLPLLRALNVLAKQERDTVLKNTIDKLAESVQGGSTFSESLALYPLIFNDLYVNMVKAGEVGGVLELVLTRLAEFQEKAAKIKNKVAAAMVYPLIVMTMAVAIMGFLLVFIVPKFEAIFHDMLGDRPLPVITKFVLTVSRFVQGHWLVILALLFAAIAGYKFANRTPRGKSTIDRAKLHFPLFGDVIRKTAISRFSRTLGTLVSSGVPILQALNITRETAGNMVIARAIGQVHESVKEGESIVQPLEASAVFPPMVVSMIDVGEETGQLPEMLLKIADVYDDEVDNSVAAMTAALEPIMIVFLALVVGTIVIALFLPLISIIQGLQQQT